MGKYRVSIKATTTRRWQRGRPDNPTPFHPPYAEMKQIINEITAALLQFCVKAG